MTHLERHEQVIGLSVSSGASIKPPGDVITVHVLNRGADDVLTLVAQATPDYSIVTAETASIIDLKLDAWIENDIDEALWEELETGLRHQGRITPNFLALMALGGVLACLGLTTEGAPQATALIAASIIAPGFEPIAKVALGLSLRRWNVVKRGLISTLGGYSVFIVTAGLTPLLLRLFGAVTLNDFTENSELARLARPGVGDHPSRSGLRDEPRRRPTGSRLAGSRTGLAGHRLDHLLGDAGVRCQAGDRRAPLV
ncbi:DUF389 domain-containing protein [Deinococcus altitudinis]|uniref:DUF389 domain-containing protein n=1 Tax=Deinococcus altitudinis TaxID=468914 RepID=UPI0038917645